MKLSQAQKIIVGILTLAPFILVPYIVFQIFGFVMETVQASQGGEPEVADVMAGIISFIVPVLFLAMLNLALLIFYIVHAVNNKSIDTTERIVWILIFIFVGLIPFAIYWFMRIWGEEPPRAQS